ncbi:MAG: HAD family hydrolase [Sulfurospirillum sp.]|nr:HAD family hydrolase [Sulfurospirillum sp.]
MNKIKNILWDFDGVILDSMPIRDYGFRKIFESYPEDLVEGFIRYHRLNGGLSRFHKIKYFYNHLLNKEISEKQIQDYAEQFTIIMKEQLTNEKYLIRDSVDFIKSNHKNYNFHIVSGSEHHELNYLCKNLDLADFFLSIKGSPTPKNNLVKNLLEKEQYKKEETILIGDSINDFDAANINGIEFYGYNNEMLREIYKHIDNFKDKKWHI